MGFIGNLASYPSSGVNQKISKERENFTIAHELGHIVLHKTITNSIQSISENQNSINSELNIGKSDITRMEYQANTFASYLLMPSRPFLVKVTELFKQYSITTGRLYLDHQPCNKKQCNIILGQIADHFIVSKEAVKVRMKKDQLLVEEDRMKTMRDILR